MIGRRTLEAVRWQAAATPLRVGVGFARFVVLARLLPVEVFGVYALAVAAVRLTVTLPQFGLTAAFLHRAPETADEEPAASVLFTLRLLLVSAWALALAAAGWLLADGGLRVALVTLAACQWAAEPAFVPRQLLVRRLRFGRVALFDGLDAVLGTAVAVGLALGGAQLGALLATNVVSAALQLVVFVAVAPPWRPRVRLDPPVVRYLLRFGSRGLAASVLDRLLERLADVVTGTLLGNAALGLFTRARRLAQTPQQVLADPLLAVLPASYAELGPRRAELSHAARDSLSLLARGTSLVAAVLFVVAPWLVGALLGARWLPAADALRVLSPLVALEPLRLALTALLVALGRPGQVARLRVLQTAALAAGLGLAALAGSIAAVAAAVTAAAAVGVASLAVAVRSELPLAPARIFAAPVAAGVAAGIAGSALSRGAELGPALGAALAAAAVHVVLLLALDRGELLRLARALRVGWSAR